MYVSPQKAAKHYKVSKDKKLNTHTPIKNRSISLVVLSSLIWSFGIILFHLLFHHYTIYYNMVGLFYVSNTSIGDMNDIILNQYLE